MTELSELTTDELLANFELLGDWEERYRYIIDLGRKLPPLADEDRTEENRVHGCQATVWLKETLAPTEPPTIEIRADSDAHIVKGLIAILIVLYSGKTPDAVLALDPRPIFESLGLDRFLSPTRHNGLYAMVERVRTLASEPAKL
ncbi:MAG TPA: SufE family protein [Planctomycetota bacterium]|nr:SufE family protein [Planctomycetota bacterium]